MSSFVLLVLILAAAVVAMCLIGGIKARRSEEAVRQRNILLDGALNNMSQGLNMFDSAGRVVRSNERYIDMYGLTREIARPGVTVRELVEARVAAGTFFKTDPE